MLCPECESKRVKGEGAAAPSLISLTESTIGGIGSSLTDHEKN